MDRCGCATDPIGLLAARYRGDATATSGQWSDGWICGDPDQARKLEALDLI